MHISRYPSPFLHLSIFAPQLVHYQSTCQPIHTQPLLLKGGYLHLQRARYRILERTREVLLESRNYMAYKTKLLLTHIVRVRRTSCHIIGSGIRHFQDAYRQFRMATSVEPSSDPSFDISRTPNPSDSRARACSPSSFTVTSIFIPTNSTTKSPSDPPIRSP